jgi:hypothetical protein
MRLAVPTKLEVEGVGETGGGGGSGVPISTGDSGGIPTAGTTGVVRNRIAIETRATITRNTTHSRIRSFNGLMSHLESSGVPEVSHKGAKKDAKAQREFFFVPLRKLCAFV